MIPPLNQPPEIIVPPTIDEVISLQMLGGQSPEDTARLTVIAQDVDGDALTITWEKPDGVTATTFVDDNEEGLAVYTSILVVPASVVGRQETIRAAVLDGTPSHRRLIEWQLEVE